MKRYVYSGTSGAASLQHFVEHNVYHRQGKMALQLSSTLLMKCSLYLKFGKNEDILPEILVTLTVA